MMSLLVISLEFFYKTGGKNNLSARPAKNSASNLLWSDSICHGPRTERNPEGKNQFTAAECE
jgi:hypothetical protein